MASKRKPPSRYHHGALKPALLSTAWAFVAKEGVEALSLRAVADALGVSHAAPAHHFKDREALVDALRVEAWRRFADALEAAPKGPHRLRHAGRAYIAFAHEHPRQVQLMFRAGARPASPDVGAQSQRAWTVLFESVRASLTPERAGDEAAVRALAVAAWASVHGLASLFNEVAMPAGLGTDGASRRALQERLLDVVEAGLNGGA